MMFRSGDYGSQIVGWMPFESSQSLISQDVWTGALSCIKVYSPSLKLCSISGNRLSWSASMYFCESILPLTQFKVLSPENVMAPQTITLNLRLRGGHTKCGESFSSIRLQLYILLSFPITTEHSSEKINLFHDSIVQFFRDLAHFFLATKFSVLITTDFRIDRLT